MTLPESLRQAFPQQNLGGSSGQEQLRSSRQSFKESRALLARVRRAAYAVLASSAVLAPLLIACFSVAGHHLHSQHRTWLLAIALSAFSALALLLAALGAVRCLSQSGLGAPVVTIPLVPQKFARGKADPTREAELLLERAQENRRRVEQSVGPLMLARRSLTLSIVTLVCAGVAVLVAGAL